MKKSKKVCAWRCCFTLIRLILPHSIHPIGWLNREPFSILNQTNQCWVGLFETIRKDIQTSVPLFDSVQTGLPIWVGELNQNRKGPSSLTDLKRYLCFCLTYTCGQIFISQWNYLFIYFYFFCHGLISRWPQKSEFMGRTFFGRL